LQNADRIYTSPSNLHQGWHKPDILEAAVIEYSLEHAPYDSPEQAREVIRHIRLGEDYE
jgi:hypothetical protein|tara:strand:+ start:962 stop:1138 length:177 start_codon:yes stop_codon:yes gene_type:complete